MMQSQEVLYLGPSHVQRLEHAMRSRQLPVRQAAKFVHAGGLPIWAPEIDRAVDGVGCVPRFIVGDFRFGNKIVDVLHDASAYPRLGRRVGIDGSLINHHNDKKMYDFSISALDDYVSRRGDSVLLFWDLLIREYRNRKSARYGRGQDYRHPIWNLSDVIKRYSHFSIDTMDLVENDILDALALDNSGHPSLKGWIFILNALDRVSIADTLSKVEAFDDHVRQNMFCSTPDMVFVGDGALLKLIHQLVERGALILPERVRLCPDMGVAEALGTGALTVEVPHLPSASGPSEGQYARQVRRLRERIKAYHGFSNYRVLLWAPWAKNLIAGRVKSYSKYLPSSERLNYQNIESGFGRSIVRLSEVDGDIADGMVQLHTGLDITQFGVMALMSHIVHGRVGAADVSRYHEAISPFFEYCFASTCD